MEKIRKERTILRGLFTKAANALESLLKESRKDDEIRNAFMWAKQKAEDLLNVDESFRQYLYDIEGEAEIMTEVDQIESYKLRWFKLSSEYEKLTIRDTHDAQSESSYASANMSKRNFKLPKLQLQKYDGNLKNWLSFWGQFKKIDEDETIDDDDKFQYLLQATSPGSSARELVESFPPSGPNYRNAIKMMKSRFARDELLIELYIRELLKLVLNKETSSIRSLHDKLMTQLQALETLNVTREKYAAMLYPMVESTLPEDVLRAWERCRRNPSKDKVDDKDVDHLAGLLKFLGREVDSEERIEIARSGFNENSQSSSAQLQPTAACIISGDSKKKDERECLWCNRTNHSSSECFQARNMSIEVKKDIIKKKGACFICLKKNHCARKCKAFVKCIICTKRHPAVLCPQIGEGKEAGNSKAEVSTKQPHNEGVLLCCRNNVTLLPTLLVRIEQGKDSIVVRALIDSGSQRSYIKKEIAEQLGLTETSNEILGHFLFGGTETAHQVYKCYAIKVRSLNGDFATTMKVLDQNKICGHVPKINSNSKVIAKLQKCNVTLTDADDERFEIQLLIGSDNYAALITDQYVSINENLVAVKTKLGWTIQGQTGRIYSSTNTSVSETDVANIWKLDIVGIKNFSLTDLWDLDVLGIKDPIAIKNSDALEAKAVKNFNETVSRLEDGRYEVKLPWIESSENLLSNRALAENRLMSTSRRLKSLGKFDNYDNVFKEWEELGIIELVTEPNRQISLEHYIPHHAVIKDSGASTTKIRPVFDASAVDKNGISLNKCLEKGPNLIEIIPTILLKFRIGLIGVISDIKKAFLQISIYPEDRDVLRFLWWEDESLQKIKIYRHSRVVFGVTSSPFLLAATIAHHLNRPPQNLKKTAEKLKDAFYVDNCVTSVDDKLELEKFIFESRLLMSSAKFDLRGWVYNSDSLFCEKEEEMPTTGNVVSVLGLQWDFKDDTLFCNLHGFNEIEEIPLTKRGLLSAAQRVFDPIGFTCVVTLIPKLLLQEIWKIKLNWDSELPKETSQKFKTWLKQIDLLKVCRIPRSFSKLMNFQKCSSTLHVFCDASKIAYGACIFIRIIEDHTVNIHLVQAKSRVAPIKSISIPRLELLSAVIGCRLYQSIKKVDFFRNLDTYFWSDSKVALTWIKTKSNWNIFVNNRVSEIRLSTDINKWNHVPGELNPADLLSRGCSVKVLLETKWWTGPKWLKENIENWPIKVEEFSENEAYKELQKRTVSCQVTLSEDRKERFSCALTYFSKYCKIIRMVSWMIRFIKNCRERTHNQDFKNYKRDLSVEEYINGEKILLRLIQKENFDESEVRNKITKKPLNLELFTDDEGLLRVKTRLTFSEEVENFKSPILLPNDHEIIRCLVRHKHCELQHAGTQTLMSNLRELYWIIGVRSLAKKIISQCVICKRYKQKSVQPPPAPLPDDRIKNAKTFEVTGIDLAGPLYLRSGEKCWIVMFTCGVYRAVHLELASSLSTDTFIMALRRFISRRGRPEVIYTDNGTNFVGTENRLSALDWSKITSFSAVKKIKWKFNPPSAPWWGGWWERLIRMLKEMLRRLLGQATISYEELETVLFDCEAIMNSRPLTYLGDDWDNLKPLTPACFLQGMSNTEVPDLDTIDHKSLNNRMKYLQKLRADFRTRFRNEYLGLLVQRGKSARGELKVGDVVLVGSEEKRIKWPLGVILEIYPGRDSHARVAKVKTTAGVKVRPFQRLYPLEVSEVKESNDAETDIDNEDPSFHLQDKTSEVQTRCGRIIKKPCRFEL